MRSMLSVTGGKKGKGWVKEMLRIQKAYYQTYDLCPTTCLALYCEYININIILSASHKLPVKGWIESKVRPNVSWKM